MSFSHGNDAELKIQNAAGTLVDISTYLTSISMPREIEANETSTMRIRDRTYVPGLRGRTVSFEGRWDAAVDAILDGITGMTREFEYSPAGSGVGHSGPGPGPSTWRGRANGLKPMIRHCNSRRMPSMAAREVLTSAAFRSTTSGMVSISHRLKKCLIH